MSRRLRDPRLILGLAVVFFLVGLRFGVATYPAITGISLSVPASIPTDWQPGRTKPRSITVFPDGRLIFLTSTGYGEIDLAAEVADQFFADVERTQARWQDDYPTPGAQSLIRLTLGGIDRRIDIEDLYQNAGLPSSLRSIIATLGRWSREALPSATPLIDPPISFYLVDPPVDATGPASPLPSLIDEDAARSNRGFSANTATLAAIQQESPVVGTLQNLNFIIVTTTDGKRAALIWNVDWRALGA